MAYLMVKYRDTTTYALLDLSDDELGLIRQGLGEVEALYEKLGASEEALRPIRTLSAAIERRYGDD